MTNIELITQVAKDIHQKGGSLFFVGGYVRDKMLGKTNKDIDVEIHNISVEETKQILSKYGHVDTVGAAFGVLMVKGYDIDFAFPRTENKSGDKHTDFDVMVNPYLTTEEAAKRRDFTMNAIMENVLTGEIVDPYNGVNDIKNKIIKIVNHDTYIEDPLRSLRAAQFASRLGFTLDEQVIQVAKQMDYSHLSAERIEEELNKALLSDKPSIAFNYLKEMHVLEHVFPELVQLSTVEQDKEHHPEGSVWNHTMLVTDAAAQLKGDANNPLFFMYASLLHDIGKLTTTKHVMENGHVKITSYGHDKEGAELSREMLKRFSSNKKLRRYVSAMTEHHMNVHWYDTLSDYKLRQIMLSVDINDLILLNKADKLGRNIIDEQRREKINNHINGLTDKVSSLSNGEFGEIKPFITGKRLMSFGMKPGPKMGRHIKELYDLQLKGKSEDELLEEVKRRLVKPLVTSEDIFAMGYKQGPEFGAVKKKAREMELEGMSREEIINNLTS